MSASSSNRSTDVAVLAVLDDGATIELRCGAHVGRRTLASSPWNGWSAGYADSLGKHDEAVRLLRLGEDMGAWLDGEERWLRLILSNPGAPIPLELRVGVRPTAAELAFLEAPWELLASAGQHLAARDDVMLSPYRRLGAPEEPQPPSPYRLSMSFMAAAPADVPDLFYEGEETAILAATGQIGLDLHVEESGALDRLAEQLATHGPFDVVHVSAHGLASPPRLLLETEIGDRDLVEVDRFHAALGGHAPWLLFLSACLTAAADDSHSFASALVPRGWPAVLGWAGNVGDADATAFASSLYEHLSRRADLVAAVGHARRAAIGWLDHRSPSLTASNWHLGRLYLGPRGGGPIAGGTDPRAPRAGLSGAKGFLGRDGRVRVASREAFVGRRRPLQAILREARTRTHAGVLVHGMGRQGKSSLAARVAERLAATHTLVVVFEHYDALAILDAIVTTVGTRQAAAVLAQHRDNLQPAVMHVNARAFEIALRALLDGPCGGPNTHPILLVIDDFERLLELPRPSEPAARLLPDAIEVIRALVQTFAVAATRSLLLVTSRYRFSLLDRMGADLAARLLDVPVAAMRPVESRKQLRAQTLALSPELAVECIERSRGNPGLQDLLVRIAIESPARWEATRATMDVYLAGKQAITTDGSLLHDEEVVDFLSGLAIQTLLGCLTPDERALLKAMRCFDHPVPEDVVMAIARDRGVADPKQRLIGLGLMDRMTTRARAEVQLNPLVMPRLDAPSDVDRHAIANVALPVMAEVWRATPAIDALAYEIVRAAARVGDREILSWTITPALKHLIRHQQDKVAGELAADLVRRYGDVPLEPQELRLLCDTCLKVYDYDAARIAIERAATPLDVDPDERARILATRAQFDLRDGDVARAIETVTAAAARFRERESWIEYATALRDLAYLHGTRGETEHARSAFLGSIEFFEKAGDARGCARTLTELAMFDAHRGALDQAAEHLGRARELCERAAWPAEEASVIAATAVVEHRRGHADAALRLYEKAIPMLESVGAALPVEEAWMGVAEIHASRGDFLNARGVLDRRLIATRAVGDFSGSAKVLAFLMRFDLQQGDFPSALSHSAEAWQDAQRSGRLDILCPAGRNHAAALSRAGEIARAVDVLTYVRVECEKLGRGDLVAAVDELLGAIKRP